MLYYAVISTFRDSLDFPMLMPKPCSGDFKDVNKLFACRHEEIIDFPA